MIIATYTITIDGSSSGNVIAQPFTVEVTKLTYMSDADLDNSKLVVYSCCKNQAAEECTNDDIADVLVFGLPVMTASKNADLTATFETALTAAYGVNWSKN